MTTKSLNQPFPPAISLLGGSCECFLNNSVSRKSVFNDSPVKCKQTQLKTNWDNSQIERNFPDFKVTSKDGGSIKDDEERCLTANEFDSHRESGQLNSPVKSFHSNGFSCFHPIECDPNQEPLFFRDKRNGHINSRVLQCLSGENLSDSLLARSSPSHETDVDSESNISLDWDCDSTSDSSSEEETKILHGRKSGNFKSFKTLKNDSEDFLLLLQPKVHVLKLSDSIGYSTESASSLDQIYSQLSEDVFRKDLNFIHRYRKHSNQNIESDVSFPFNNISIPQSKTNSCFSSLSDFDGVFKTKRHSLVFDTDSKSSDCSDGDKAKKLLLSAKKKVNNNLLSRENGSRLPVISSDDSSVDSDAYELELKSDDFNSFHALSNDEEKRKSRFEKIIIGSPDYAGTTEEYDTDDFPMDEIIQSASSSDGNFICNKDHSIGRISKNAAEEESSEFTIRKPPITQKMDSKILSNLKRQQSVGIELASTAEPVPDAFDLTPKDPLNSSTGSLNADSLLLLQPNVHVLRLLDSVFHSNEPASVLDEFYSKRDEKLFEKVNNLNHRDVKTLSFSSSKKKTKKVTLRKKKFRKDQDLDTSEEELQNDDLHKMHSIIVAKVKEKKEPRYKKQMTIKSSDQMTNTRYPKRRRSNPLVGVKRFNKQNDDEKTNETATDFNLGNKHVKFKRLNSSASKKMSIEPGDEAIGVGEKSSTRLSKVTKRRRASGQYLETDESSEIMPEDESDPDEARYCICNQLSYDSMVSCDNEKCPFEWLHFECVGITQAPNPKIKWFCPPCRAKRRKSKLNV